MTSNANKFREISGIISDLKQLKLDLDEIQSLDPQVVIAHKLGQAASLHQGSLMVEDSSLSLNALGGLPGPYIKSFRDAIGLDGIAELAGKYGDQTAIARTVIGYQAETGERHYFTGELKGLIVPPRNAGGFGWDDIFVPQGHTQTFSELGPEKKATMSMRRLAADKLKLFLHSA